MCSAAENNKIYLTENDIECLKCLNEIYKVFIVCHVNSNKDELILKEYFNNKLGFIPEHVRILFINITLFICYINRDYINREYYFMKRILVK